MMTDCKHHHLILLNRVADPPIYLCDSGCGKRLKVTIVEIED